MQMAWTASLVIPWLNPLAGGPSSSVQPWLVSALCASVLLALRGWRVPPFPLPLWIAFAAVATAVRALPSLESIAALGGLAMIAMTAGTVAHDRAVFVRAIAAAWLAAACVSAAIALIQYFGAGESLSPWVSHAVLGEAYGNLRQRNQLASLLAIGSAALTWFVGRGLPWRWSLPLVSVLAAATAASASRTGAVQWVLLLALAAVWRHPRRREAVAVGAFGIAMYALFSVALPALLSHGWGITGPSVFARFVGDAGCGSRRVLWGNVLYLIAQRPWTGWGWGELDWAHYMTLYPGERFCDILDNAHSLPLHLAVELGIPVAVLACAGMVWALVRIAPWRETDPARQLALATLAVILVHSLVEYPLWYGPFQIAFGLSLGLLWPSSRVPAIASRGSTGAMIAAALALGAVSYAAWDYRRVSQIYMAPETRDEAYRDDPLPRLRHSRIFRVHVQFAELTTTPLTRANAQWTYDTALEMLHYSPEPRVIEKTIESATMLGHMDVALAQLQRYEAAFPKEHAQWAKERAR